MNSIAEDWVVNSHGLSKSFKNVHALRPLDLKIPRNSIFGFLGPNGAGKTTTIKLLLGLLRPSSGSASVFGLDITRDSLAIRDRIGYLPQEPRYYEHMSARQVLDYTARFYFKGPAHEIRKRVNETLELVGLEDKADRSIKGFSGGERQRLGIGQAQVNYPDLLILDEPAASLDPMGRRDVLRVMERLRKHATVFYCTHILDDVQRVSDTVAILNQGELVTSGPIEDLLTGGNGIVYSVTMKGDTQTVYNHIDGLDWVTEIQASVGHDKTTWTITVANEVVAEAKLLRMLLDDESLTVTDFRRKEYQLEEVFIQIVEGH